MAFTLVKLTATYRAGGLPCSGQVVLRLTVPMQDGSGASCPVKVFVCPLDSLGRLSYRGSPWAVLEANDDPPTDPSGATWTVTEQISGALGSRPSYQVVIPHGAPGGTIDLATLAPTVAQAQYNYMLVSQAVDPSTGLLNPVLIPPGAFAPNVSVEVGAGGVSTPTLTVAGTVFGIEAAGRPYYQGSGAVAGEEATLGPDLSLSTLPFVAPATAAAATDLTAEALRAHLAEATNAGAVVIEAANRIVADAANTLAVTQEASTARAAEATKLPLSGGNLTGPLGLAGPPTSPLQPATKVYADQHAFWLAMGGGLLSWDTFARGDRDLTIDTAPSGETYVTIATAALKAYIAGGMMIRSSTSTFGGNGAAFAYSPHVVQPTVLGALFRFTSFDVNTPGTPATTRGQNLVVGATPAVFSNPSSIQFAVWPDTWQLFYTHFNGVSTDIVVLQSGTWATPLAVDDLTAYFAVMRLDTSTSPNWTVRCELNGVLVTSYSGTEINSYWGNRQGTQIRHQVATDGDVRVLARAAAATATVAGITVAAAPSASGKVLTSTSGTAGAWQDPSVPDPIALASIGDPATPIAGNAQLYPKSVLGQDLWFWQNSTDEATTPEPALFSGAVTYIGPGSAAALTTLGTGATSVGTITHVFAELLGYYANFVSGAVAGNTAGTGDTTLRWLRGSQVGSNGFLFRRRLCFPDAGYGAGATGSRVFVGLTSGVMSASVATDDPGVSTCGFVYSTNRGDTNWQVSHASGVSGQTLLDTGIPFTAGHVYDFGFGCAPQGGTIYWRVKDITAGTVASGSFTTALPNAGVVMRAGHQIATLTTTARNVGLMSGYCRSGR